VNGKTDLSLRKELRKIIMSKGKKKPKLKKQNNKKPIEIASIVTAISALLKVIFDFIIQLLSLGNNLLWSSM